jgi:hypothetical protein
VASGRRTPSTRCRPRRTRPIANLRAEWKTAEPDRRKVIEAEVAGLQQPEPVTAEDAFEPEGGDA